MKMTDEELRKESTCTVQWECTPVLDRPTFVNGYITGSKPREEHIASLEKENAELKEALIKAKEVIKKFLELINNKTEFDSEHPQEHTDLWNELCEKAKQFMNSTARTITNKELEA